MSSSPLVWVIGSSGLLGTSVWSELGADAWRPQHALTWREPGRLTEELRDAVRAFGERVLSEKQRAWGIAWCAGAGVVGTSADALAEESRAFQSLLALLSADRVLSARPGAMSLASSAGGVYGGCRESSITEYTPPQPISAYGHAKLAQEQLFEDWVDSQPHVRGLVARFSNLYGPAQRLEKPQGLISHISRCAIHCVPVHIYVSLDTVRDYLFADDAGRALVEGLRRVLRDAQSEQKLTIKIYASENEVSIATLLGVFRQIARRRLRVISGLHPTAALQPRRLRFRSRIWNVPRRRVELVEGVSRVYSHQQGLFRRGQLPRQLRP
jgi:UDP-glucose 4-epimerase